MLRPMHAITRRPSPRLAECELTHMAREPIDAGLAERQHAAYRAALAACGLAVVDLPALDEHPDGCFVEDVAIALPELFVLTRPGAASRRGEVDALAACLGDDRPVERLAGPATLDGGDVLAIGRHLFVGRSTRTNEAGVAALAAIVRRHGYSVTAIEVPGALHLKTAATALADDLVLINPAWVPPDRFAPMRHLAVAADEPFAGNSLRAGRRIVMQASHARTAETIGRTGFAVDLVDISEFAKAEAGLTCMSILVPDPRARG